MSRRYPVCNAKEVTKVLRRHGFLCVGQSGSKPIPIGTLKSIIEGSGLDVENFR